MMDEVGDLIKGLRKNCLAELALRDAKILRYFWAKPKLSGEIQSSFVVPLTGQAPFLTCCLALE